MRAIERRAWLPGREVRCEVCGGWGRVIRGVRAAADSSAGEYTRACCAAFEFDFLIEESRARLTLETWQG